MIERLGDLGDLFRQFREMEQLTQEALADRCGAAVNRTQIALLEQGRRLPKPDSLRAIAAQLRIPEETWAPFAKDESHLRQQFEASVSELVGRMVGLRSMDIESVHAAEGLTSIIVTHNERLAALCDRVFHMEDGELLEHGAAAHSSETGTGGR